jgi:tetratricopeptide (TPR) repeat protein
MADPEQAPRVAEPEAPLRMSSEGAEKKLDEIVEEHARRISQLENASRRTLWLSLIPILSLIVAAISAGSAFLTYNSKIEDTLRSKRGELRQAIEKVVDFHFSMSKDREQNNINHTKQNVYLDAAESIAKDFPKQVSYQEYMVLGREMFLRGNYTKAETYLDKAVESAEKSKDDIAVNLSARDLAYLEFNTNINNIKKGRDNYQKAFDVFKDTKDDYLRCIFAITNELWGVSERSKGFEKEGKCKLNIASKIYSDLKEKGYPVAYIRSMTLNVPEDTIPTQENDVGKEDSQECGDKK